MKSIFTVLAAIVFVAGCSRFDPLAPPPPTPTSASTIFGWVTANGTGISGVVVSLAGPVTRATSTSTNGKYTFSGLGLGDYIVSMSSPYQLYEFAVSSKSVGVQSVGNYEASFSGVSPATPPVGATILGLVWLDANTNGQYDSGEAVFVGITMTLSGPANRQIQTATNGRYAFTDLGAGNYDVVLANPNTALYRFDAEKTGGGVSKNVGINDAHGTVFTADFRAVKR